MGISLGLVGLGASVRICEFRDSGGHLGEEGETFRVLGTKGMFSEDVWSENGRTTHKNGHQGDRTQLTKEEMRNPLPKEVSEAFKRAMNKDIDEKDLQNMDFNPQGHGGSHPYLVHEFVDSIVNNRQPAINIWEAARYMAMGVMAHKSALKNGETLKVPDWGDAPE